MGGAKWPTIQGVDYYGPGDSTTNGNYRYRNRFPHPKLIAEPSTIGANYGANLFVGYFDASPYHRSLNFVSFRMTAPGIGAANNNLTGITAGYQKSPDVEEIPGTRGASSEWFAMSKVGANGIAVAYYDEVNKVLKLASSTRAYSTTGVTTTENKTVVDTFEVSKLTVSNSLAANWSGKFFTVYSGSNAYDVWYDTTGTATKPAGATSANALKVNISAYVAADNPANRISIATATYNALIAAAGNPFSVTGDATAVLNIRSNLALNTANISTNLTTGGTVATTTDGSLVGSWSTITIDSTADVGQHVSMVSDGSGKLYLAYYDFDNANLKFARISWNNGAPTVDGKVTVDNYLSAGTWTNISLVTNSNLTGQASLQPVIAYYADSYNGTRKPIRFAFPKFNAYNGANGLLVNGADDGTDADAYTGNWEVITVPSTGIPGGGATTFNRVQLGVNSAGTLPVVGWVGSKLEYAKLQPNN
jgi:hypothetical protein